MNTSRNFKSLYDSMVEYSFDNSLMNSHNSKMMNHIYSHGVSAKDSLHKLSVFSESQSFQNFIKRKTQNYEENENIYLRRYEFRRETETQESSGDMQKIIQSTKIGFQEGEQTQLNDIKHNIYKYLGRPVEREQAIADKGYKPKINSLFSRDNNNEPIIINKNEVFMKKKPLVDPKLIKLNINTNKLATKVIKPVAISTTAKASRMMDIFDRKKSYTGVVKDFANKEYSTLSRPKKSDKKLTTNDAYSSRDIHANKFSTNPVSIEKTRKKSTTSLRDLALSTKAMKSNQSIKNIGLRNSHSKEKYFHNLSLNTFKDKESRRLMPFESNYNDSKTKNSLPGAKHLSSVDKSKEKLEKSLKKMQKYRKLKQDYKQKLVNDSREYNKHYKTFSAINIPSDDICRSNNNGNNCESGEYRGDIRSLFDHSSSNNTTGKSIDNLESLVKRICSKNKK